MLKDKKKPNPSEGEEEEKDEAESTEEEEEEESSEDSEEEEEALDSDKDLDADLEKERTRGKPDSKKAREAFEARQAKRAARGEDVEDEEEEDEDDDKPMTRREMREFMEGQNNQLQKTLQADRIREIAKGMASSDKEAELIVTIHKNRSWPSSVPLSEQIEEAWAIANRKKMISKNKELGRALKGDQGASRSGTGGHQDVSKGPAPKVAPDVLASLKRAGFTFDSKSRKWVKKLKNGKSLIKDTATGRPYLG